MSERWVKAIVMIIVAVAWLAYVGTELTRGRTPEAWTWGILTGVFAALYQPWTAGRRAGGLNRGDNEQRPDKRIGPGDEST